MPGQRKTEAEADLPGDSGTSPAIVVFVTASDREEASRLANGLLESGLAACVQILPEIESIYRWQGKVERQSEYLLLIKTTRSSFEALERKVLSLHSYDTPEIIALPVIAGSTPYLQWLSSSIRE